MFFVVDFWWTMAYLGQVCQSLRIIAEKKMRKMKWRIEKRKDGGWDIVTSLGWTHAMDAVGRGVTP